MLRARSVVATALVVAALPCALSCNRRVFEEVQNACNLTIETNVDIPTNKAADILIVVDNSGSMSEEQKNLVDNFLNPNENECPLQDLTAIPPQFTNPTRDLYTGNGPLAKCGFIQLLAAFQSDFRVGVITSTVSLCDNELPAAQAQPFCQANPGIDECAATDADSGGWGFRPQRGCLQPNGPPGTLDKVISAADLTDPNKKDLASRFKATLDNIRVFGSPYERELDAAAVFLQQAPGVKPNPDCDGDFDLFRRKDAALSVIFISDEDDCPHFLPGSTIDDELSGETCGVFQDMFLPPHLPGNCYADTGQQSETASPKLSPVEAYKNALLAADPNVKVAVIAGGLGEPGNLTASGCHVGSDGSPTGGDCLNSGGLSNFTGDGQQCDPDVVGPDFPAGCCTADPGSRYFDLADTIGKNKDTDSICNASFRATMLDIAALVASTDTLELAEPPTSPNAVVVKLTKAGTADPTIVDHLADNADCATQDGWKFESETRIDLCGTARPGPGDNIGVQAEGTPKNGCQ